jgi:alpha-galactosidase
MKFWEDFLPFSFLYNGRNSREIIEKWERDEKKEEFKDLILKKVLLFDKENGLKIEIEVKEYKIFNCIEWVLKFKNHAKKNSPLISEVMPLDIEFNSSNKDKVILNYSKGSQCRIDDFLLLREEIGINSEKNLKPYGGRSSNGILPFFNLQIDDEGIVIGIGWTGQWKINFLREDKKIKIKCGMERTNFFLYPDEEVRTPSIVIINYKGNDFHTGNNILRRFLIFNSQKIDGNIFFPPVSICSQATYYKTGKTSEKFELELLKKGKKLGAEVHWIDACWYGNGGEWWQEVGNWYVRNDFFLNGLKPISDKVHEEGLKFLLWFEPERVRRETEIFNKYPQFLLNNKYDKDNFLLNLSLKEAREFILEKISGIIEREGVDIYRQDCNFELLPYWEENEEKDRKGIIEIKHIEGLYFLWDSLKNKFKNLLIDNCASGGRRIDIETLKRSFPLWRSDFSDFPSLKREKWLTEIGNQVQTSGLSLWVPFHGGGIWVFKSYEFRSGLSTGFTFSIEKREDYPPDKDGEIKKAIEEIKILRNYFLGDFYLLSPLTVEKHDWCAYQFHREDLDSGFALFLRRHQSHFPVIEVQLYNIDTNKKYEVIFSKKSGNYRNKKIISGEKLKNIKISIKEKPGSLLLIYKKI